ncbi:hypothetical protein [Elioraea sp.]|uniref:hypothetical protein n=1 Tax=Elioraea sp. TaxID=2185103 RepID=UPI00307F7184
MSDAATTLERLSTLEDLAARRDPRCDPLGWARAEAALCRALAEEGAHEERIDWLVEAAIRAADAVTARPLPIELREALLETMRRALRTLARQDGRGRRRPRPAARSCA